MCNNLQLNVYLYVYLYIQKIKRERDELDVASFPLYSYMNVSDMTGECIGISHTFLPLSKTNFQFKNEISFLQCGSTLISACSQPHNTNALLQQ